MKNWWQFRGSIAGAAPSPPSAVAARTCWQLYHPAGKALIAKPGRCTGERGSGFMMTSSKCLLRAGEGLLQAFAADGRPVFSKRSKHNRVKG